VSRPITLRLPDETAERLQAWARRAGRSVSEVGARSIEEWLRQSEFADIEFRSFGGERHACLKGAPQVWQVVMVAQDYAMDVDKTAAHFGWPVHRVRAALNYYEAYPAEIDRAIEDNRSISYDQLKRALPRVERLTVPSEPADERPSR
jgi:Ribbon-helix-helix protein, copG family